MRIPAGDERAVCGCGVWGVERAWARAERDEKRRAGVRGASLLKRLSKISLSERGERGARPSRSAGLAAVVKLFSHLTRIRKA